VAARLNPDKRYGIWWANRYEVKTIRESKPDGRGGKPYERRHIRTERYREQWIAVPVPDAGIPPEHVEPLGPRYRATGASHLRPGGVNGDYPAE